MNPTHLTEATAQRLADRRNLIARIQRAQSANLKSTSKPDTQPRPARTNA